MRRRRPRHLRLPPPTSRLAGVGSAPARADRGGGARRARHGRAPPPRLASTDRARVHAPRGSLLHTRTPDACTLLLLFTLHQQTIIPSLQTARSSAGSEPCSPHARILCASEGGAALAQRNCRARCGPPCAPCAPCAPHVRGAPLRRTERGWTCCEAGVTPVGAPHARLLASRGVAARAAVRGDAQRDAPLACLDCGTEAALPRRDAGLTVGLGR